jgi:hypothetical protein
MFREKFAPACPQHDPDVRDPTVDDLTTDDLTTTTVKNPEGATR